MPTISVFYGIMIRMFFCDVEEHNIPHIHIKYAEYEAVMSIESGYLLAGDLPRKQLRLVQAWVELRQDELRNDWLLAVNGKQPNPILPL